MKTLEDYPYLTSDDIEFAKLYTRGGVDENLSSLRSDGAARRGLGRI